MEVVKILGTMLKLIPGEFIPDYFKKRSLSAMEQTVADLFMLGNLCLFLAINL